MDFSNVTSTTNSHNNGIWFTGNYLHIKGLTFRNLYQINLTVTDKVDAGLLMELIQ